MCTALACLGACARERVQDYREVVSAASPAPPAAESQAGYRRVTSGTDTENGFFCPSADGTWAVFASNRHSRHLRLYRMDLTRAGFLYAIPGAEEGNNIFPSLTRDGALLAFAGDRDGAWRIYVVPLGGHGVPEAVTPAREDCLSPAWDPSAPPGGERLAFSRWNARDESWDVWIMECATGQMALVGPGLLPALSPDGRYLAVQRRRLRGAGQFSLWLLRADGSEPARELVMAERWAAANPAWSPDGRAIAFNSVGRMEGESLMGDGGGIYAVALDGAGRLIGPFPGGERGAWRPSWTVDNKIYFHRREGGAVNILCVDGPQAEAGAVLTVHAQAR